MTADPYKILGVSRTATADEIKQAFRRLARQHHPDHNGGGKAAEERFKAVSIAHDLLSDPGKRARYDRLGTTDPTVLSSKKQRYHLEELLCSGDLTDVHRARREADGRLVVLKIARDPSVNDLVEREAKRLAHLFPLAADPNAPQVRYLPKFWETFKADDGKRRQVNVLDFLANQYRPGEVGDMEALGQGHRIVRQPTPEQMESVTKALSRCVPCYERWTDPVSEIENRLGRLVTIQGWGPRRQNKIWR